MLSGTTFFCVREWAQLNDTLDTMDIVLELLDHYVLDDIYAKLLPSSIPPPSPPPVSVVKSTWLSLVSSFPITIQSPSVTTTNDTLLSPAIPTSAWPRDNISRQLLSLTVITTIGIHLLYFLFAGLSYRFIFNHDMMRHPRFLPNQVRLHTGRRFISF